MADKIINKLKTNKVVRFVLWPALVWRRKRMAKKFDTYNKLISNAKEGSLVVGINGLPGTYEIDIRSHILRRILVTKNYEPEIISLLKKHADPERDAVNIGANVGLFAIFLAYLVNDDHRVLAVEPTPLAFKYLINNIKRNGFYDKVLLYNGICSSSVGGFNLNTIQGNEEYSSIGESAHMNRMAETLIQIRVEGETVDNLVNEFDLDPGIILIDVEGAEMEVLKGAAEMLRRFRPVIISELNDDLLLKQKTSSAEVVGFLAGLGYDVRNITEGEIKPPFNGNIIALPRR